MSLVTLQPLGRRGMCTCLCGCVYAVEYNDYSIKCPECGCTGGEWYTVSDETKNPRGAGLKFDGDKIRANLLPWAALEWVAKVLTFGAKKYAAHSWQSVQNARERYADALVRHWCAIGRGEYLDPESGLPHIAHVACNALFLVWFDCCAGALETKSSAPLDADH